MVKVAESSHCHGTGCNIKYLPIYISVIATSAWLLVRQEVGQSSGPGPVPKSTCVPITYT